MEVTFTLDSGDVSAFQKYIASRGTRFKNLRWTVFAVGVLVFVASSVWEFSSSAHHSSGQGVRNSSINLTHLAVSVVLPVVIVFFFWFLVLRSSRLNQGNASLFSDSQTISIFVEHLLWQSKGIQTTIIWSSVLDISSDANSLYFFTGKNQAFIVPRRAFPNPEAAEMFLRRARAFWKNEPLSEAEGLNTWPPPPHIGA